MENNKLHKSFKLNGYSFSSKEALLKYANSLTTSLHSFLEEWFSLDPYIVVKTSGSTGKPKLISLKKELMINSAKATGEFFNLREGTNALLCLSVAYIAGKMMLVRALTLGWEIDIVEPVSSPLKGIDKEYDFSAMVPLQLRNSLSSIDKVKKLIVGGGVVPLDLHQEIQNTSSEIYATYGMTETITHIAVKKLNNFNGSLKINQNSFYKTLPNVTIYKDERNCLLLKAPRVADEVLKTNDVVKLVSDTQFEWLGRYDNVINSGGVKLHPEKIEEKLATLIKTRFFVIGAKDEILGEKLILLIEGLKINYDFIKLTSLTKYEIPKAVYFVPEFVETETKKIQRFKTLDLLNIQ